MVRTPRRRLRRSIRLPHLELLAAMQDTRTMSEAAKSARLTQPAASRLLRTLSDDLDIELFAREGRTLRPTAAGEALLRYSRGIMADLDRAHTELEAIDRGLIGQVAVGSGTASCYVLMPRTIDTLLRLTPKIAVSVRESSMGDLLARLREGALDIVVGRLDNSGRDRDLVVEPLYDPPMNVVSGARHRLAKKRALKWEDAMQSAWILPEFGTPMRDAIEGLFSRKRIRPDNCLVESSSIQTNVGLLNSSDLLWVLSNDIAAYFQRLGLIQILTLPATPGPSPFIATYLRGRALSPAAEKFLHALRLTAKSMNA